MKIGDRVQVNFIGSLRPVGDFVISYVPDDTSSTYGISNVDSFLYLEVFHHEIIIDVEYYRNLKLNEILDGDRG